jgi:hypothetical protein
MSNLYLSKRIESPRHHPQQPEVIHNPYYQEFLELSKKQWMFSDLLPMDKEKTILCDNNHKIKVLNILKHLYESAAEALHAFYIDRRVDLFDAHVGESACQLRAIKLALMLKGINLKLATRGLERAVKFQKQSEHLLNLIDKYKGARENIDGPISLFNIIDKYNIDFSLCADDIFLFSCYLLNTFKLILNLDQDALYYKKIINEWSLSKSASEKILRHLQKLCSFFSVSYVFQASIEPKKFNLMGYLLQKDDVGRWVLPALEITDIMLNQAISSGIPIMLEVFKLNLSNEISDSYKIIYMNSRYQLLNDKCLSLLKSNPYQPIITFQSYFSSSIKVFPAIVLLRKLSVFNFILMVKCGVSTHPQFPGSKLSPYAQHPYNVVGNNYEKEFIIHKNSELRDLQASALLHGFCKLSPQTLALNHIYCHASHLL